MCVLVLVMGGDFVFVGELIGEYNVFDVESGELLWYF